jgi:hypothetical protein
MGSASGTRVTLPPLDADLLPPLLLPPPPTSSYS